jgi:hypothetical protein
MCGKAIRHYGARARTRIAPTEFSVGADHHIGDVAGVRSGKVHVREVYPFSDEKQP